MAFEYLENMEMFNIKIFEKLEENHKITDKGTFIHRDNIRIRLFNPSNDMKLNTFLRLVSIITESLKLIN